MPKLFSLQVCRGVSAILVVCFHFGGYIEKNYSIDINYPKFYFGYCGVDFFFVLSGFIITYASFNIINNPSHLISYFKKRLFRVLPIYWLTISPLLIITLLMPSWINSRYPFSLPNLISTFFVFPFHPKVIVISWTLSHELYFYLLFSLLILSRRFLIIIYFIIILSIFNLISGYFSNSWLNFIFSPFNLEFAMGALSFYLIKNFELKKYGTFILIGGLITFIISSYLSQFDFFNRILLFGLPSFLILIGMVSIESKKSIKFPPLLIKLGDASYMIYLIHYPLITALNKIGVKIGISNFAHPLLMNLFFFIVIIISGILLYNFLEKPLLNLFYSSIKSNKLAPTKKEKLNKIN